MDAQTGTLLTPLYSREPPAAAVAAVAENPSAASVGAATAGAPPTVGLACSLFLPPAMCGMSFDVPHTHTHEDAVENLTKTVGATRDVVRDEVREEDSSSKAEESSSEEEKEDEEDD
ncbi:hypothetical protein D1007_35308 [Hordeum vulgare]|nr:hypothetical protein D1007_35308 [Hordeum vulgare]